MSKKNKETNDPENEQKFDELSAAAKPLIDWLYKHAKPHTTVLVTRTFVDVVSSEMSIGFQPRN